MKTATKSDHVNKKAAILGRLWVSEDMKLPDSWNLHTPASVNRSTFIPNSLAALTKCNKFSAEPYPVFREISSVLLAIKSHRSIKILRMSACRNFLSPFTRIHKSYPSHFWRERSVCLYVCTIYTFRRICWHAEVVDSQSYKTFTLRTKCSKKWASDIANSFWGRHLKPKKKNI